jgi:hypothetical protein
MCPVVGSGGHVDARDVWTVARKAIPDAISRYRVRYRNSETSHGNKVRKTSLQSGVLAAPGR